MCNMEAVQIESVRCKRRKSKRKQDRAEEVCEPTTGSDDLEQTVSFDTHIVSRDSICELDLNCAPGPAVSLGCLDDEKAVSTGGSSPVELANASGSPSPVEAGVVLSMGSGSASCSHQSSLCHEQGSEHSSDAVGQGESEAVSCCDSRGDTWFTGDEDAVIVAPSAPPASGCYWTSMNLVEEESIISGLSSLTSPSDTSSQVSISDGPFCFEVERNVSSVQPDPGLSAFSDSCLERYYSQSRVQRVLHDVQSLLHTPDRNCRFFRLVEAYLCACRRLCEAREQCGRLKGEVDRCRAACWRMERRQVSSEGSCGDGRQVSLQYQYESAVLDEQAVSELRRALQQRRLHLLHVTAPVEHGQRLCRLQLHWYLSQLARRVSQQPADQDEHSRQRDQLRQCCSVLFHFQRVCAVEIRSKYKADGDDSKEASVSVFFRETRGWLLQLCQWLVRMDETSCLESVFVVAHVLRCPSGMNSWALDLIPSHHADSQSHLDFLLASVSLLLSQVSGRREAVSEGMQDQACEDQEWVVVEDEEAELERADGYCRLQEQDLIPLLGALPWRGVFSAILAPVSDSSGSVCEWSMLRLFTYCGRLLGRLIAGLAVYDEPRHAQLCRLVCRYVLDCLHLASASWLCALPRVQTGACRTRLQCEYDRLVCDGVEQLLKIGHESVWHCIAQMPFAQLSTGAAWKVLWLLHTENISDDRPTGCDHKRWADSILAAGFQAQFQHGLVHMGASQVYFRLSAISALASARSWSEQLLIQTASTSVLYVSFVTVATRQLCSKAGRDLLANICAVHVQVSAHLLTVVGRHVSSMGPAALYLAAALPLCQWRPDQFTLELVCCWLSEHSIDSVPSRLARLVVDQLDWGLDVYERTTVLPAESHRKMALAVVTAQARYAPDTPLPLEQHTTVELTLHHSFPTLASLSVEQMSSSQCEFRRWCWGTMLRLRVHALDVGDSVSRLAIQQPVRGLGQVPTIGHPSLLALHGPLRAQHQPLAMFAALVLSTLGHSVPEVCGEGISMALALVRSAHLPLEVSLHLLQLTVPLFLYTPDELAAEVLAPLISAILDSVDQPSYLSSVRHLVSSGGVFEVTPLTLQKQLAGLIQRQISQHARYGLESPRGLIMVWLSCLTAVPNWQQRPALAHVLDQLLRQAFAHAPSRTAALHHVSGIVATEATSESEQVSSGRLGSLIQWVGRLAQSAQLSGVWPDTPWLSWFWLTALTDAERGSGLWPDLIGTLRETDAAVSLEDVLRRVCVQQRLPLRSQHALCLHRWAELVLCVRLECALLPEMWRSLLALLLERVMDAEGRECGGVASRLIHDQLLRRLRARLSETEQHYRHLSAESAACLRSDTIVTASSCGQVSTVADILAGFKLWLEELWRLDLPQLCVSMLPASYLPDRLTALIQTDDHQGSSDRVWSDLLVQGVLDELNENCSSGWLSLRCRDRSPKPKLRKKPVLSPRDRLRKILKGFSAVGLIEGQREQCLSPVFTCTPPELGECVTDEAADDLMATPMQQLMEHAACLSRTASQLVALHEASTDRLIGRLYTSRAVRRMGRVTCTEGSCSGAAVLSVHCLTAERDNAVNLQLQHNDAAVRTSEIALSASSADFSHAAALIQRFIDTLIGSEATPVVARIGAALFFRLGGLADVGTDCCPHVDGLLETWLQQLGSRFVVDRPEQCAALLSAVSRQTRLQQCLLQHFRPLVLPDEQYVELWRLLPPLCASSRETASAVLSRFAMDAWLREGRSSAGHRYIVIDTLAACLRETGVKADEDQQCLQEALLDHLMILLRVDMAGHFHQVLSSLLDLAAGRSVCPSVWRLLAFNLVGDGLVLDPSVHQADRLELPLATILCQYRRMLTPLQLQRCCQMLGERFLGERMKTECGRLYSRYSGHDQPLSLFLSVISAMTALSVYELDPALEPQISAQLLWTELQKLWGPWLIPLRSSNTAQLTEKSSNEILLPWTPNDVEAARAVLAGLSLVLRTLLIKSNLASALLGLVWKYYCSEFTGVGVPDHVLLPVHAALLQLPWRLLVVSVEEVECIAGVLHAFLPESHVFVSQLVVQLPWALVVEQHLGQPAACARLHSLLLTVLVRVASEPRVRQSGELFLLLSRAEAFAWHCLDEQGYRRALSWYVSACEPRAVLETDDGEPVDLVLVGLLQVAAELPASSPHALSNPSHATAKAALFVRAIVRLMCMAGFKHKALIARSPSIFTRTLHRLLTLVPCQAGGPHGEVEERAVYEDSPPDDHLVSLLITAVFGCCSDTAPEQLATVCVSALLDWLASQKNDARVLRVALKTSCTTFSSASHLAEVLESVLFLLFSIDSIGFTWHEAAALVRVPERFYKQFADVCVSSARLLVLHLLLIQELEKREVDIAQATNEGVTSPIAEIGCDSVSSADPPSAGARDIQLVSKGLGDIQLSEEVNYQTAGIEQGDPQLTEQGLVLTMAERCIDWLCRLPTLPESLEMSVCPLLHQTLSLLVTAASVSEVRVARLSQTLASLLSRWGESGSGGILGVLGLLGRRPSPSSFFRVLCRILSVTLLTNISSELRLNLGNQSNATTQWSVKRGSSPASVLPEGLLPEAYPAFEQLLASRGVLDGGPCLQLLEETIADALSSSMSFTNCLTVLSEATRQKYRHRCLHLINTS